MVFPDTVPTSVRNSCMGRILMLPPLVQANIKAALPWMFPAQKQALLSLRNLPLPAKDHGCPEMLLFLGSSSAIPKEKKTLLVFPGSLGTSATLPGHFPITWPLPVKRLKNTMPFVPSDPTAPSAFPENRQRSEPEAFHCFLWFPCHFSRSGSHFLWHLRSL